MTETNGYPPVQLSMFLLPGKDGQLVFRGETVFEVNQHLEDLLATDGENPSILSQMLENLGLLRKAGIVMGVAESAPQASQQTHQAPAAPQAPGKTCQICPNHPAMTRSSGISTRTNKPWVRHTCPQNREHIIWGD